MYLELSAINYLYKCSLCKPVFPGKLLVCTFTLKVYYSLYFLVRMYTKSINLVYCLILSYESNDCLLAVSNKHRVAYVHLCFLAAKSNQQSRKKTLLWLCFQSMLKFIFS